MPKYIQTLGRRAFYGCTGLTEFTIPESVTSVGHQIFYKCDNLETVYYNSSFSPVQDKVFLNIPSIKIVIFGNIKRIPAYVCYNSNVRDVVIPDSVTSIGSSAFSGCSSLESIEIPDSVPSIGDYAFSLCSSLTSVTIPDSVTSIGDWAFNSCNSLKNVYYSGDADDWSSISIGSHNYPIISATKYYYSATAPTESGNYWHYVDGVPTPW